MCNGPLHLTLPRPCSRNHCGATRAVPGSACCQRARQLQGTCRPCPCCPAPAAPGLGRTAPRPPGAACRRFRCRPAPQRSQRARRSGRARAPQTAGGNAPAPGPAGEPSTGCGPLASSGSRLQAHAGGVGRRRGCLLGWSAGRCAAVCHAVPRHIQAGPAPAAMRAGSGCLRAAHASMHEPGSTSTVRAARRGAGAVSPPSATAARPPGAAGRQPPAAPAAAADAAWALAARAAADAVPAGAPAAPALGPA